MLARLIDNINRQHLFALGEEVLLAVSGGRDSVCMASLMQEAGCRFAIAHCNFHLRPVDCDRDQDFVRRLAESMGVTFHTVDFDTHAYAAAHGQSVEEAARELRYGYFADLCRQHGYPCVATAHHSDDSVETFFLNLFRGTGLAGLHGILPVSEQRISGFSLKVVHPMLCFSRAEIDRYVADRGLRYVDDSTNAYTDIRRNSIRLRLMPLLRELYPSVDATMLDNMARLRDAESIYRTYIEGCNSQYVKPYTSILPNLPFDIVAIAIADIPEPSSTILFELLRPFRFNASVVGDILRTDPEKSGRLFHSATHTAELHRGQLLVAPTVAPAGDDASHDTRLWQPGDRFRPKGMHGSRLVSDFLKDLHLSRIEKQHVCVRVNAEGTILSVVGLRDAELD